MEPLFDRNRRLVGWILKERHIFDVQLSWMAYIKDENAWSSVNSNWLGPVIGLLCLDREGRVVAWNPKEKVAGISKPKRPPRAPYRPHPPKTPTPRGRVLPPMPPTPLRGWSPLSFSEWLRQ